MWELPFFSFNNYWLCFNFCIALLVCVPFDITKSVVGFKICAITAGIKNYRSIIKKKKKYDKIVFLGKTKLHTTEVLISKSSIN